MIDQAIRAGCGFAVLNNTVKDKLRVWYLTTGVDMAEILIREDGAVVDTLEFGTFAKNLGRALQYFGKPDKALEYYRRALKICLAVYYARGRAPRYRFFSQQHWYRIPCERGPRAGARVSSTGFENSFGRVRGRAPRYR